MSSLLFILGDHGLLFACFLLLFIGAYVFMAGSSFVFLYLVRPSYIVPFKIQPHMPSRKEVMHEIGWSTSTLLVWAGMAMLLIYFINLGLTKMYFDVELYGLAYLLFSIVFLIISHDAYFYWTHRWMHDSDFAYKHIHSIHHNSNNPTPFAIFSFGPTEAVVMGLYVYLVAFFVPVHIYALAILFAFNTTFNILGHMGYELVPKKVVRSHMGKVFNTSIIHDLHHSAQRSNYGLYFTFWDTYMGTAYEHNDKVRGDFYMRNS